MLKGTLEWQYMYWTWLLSSYLRSAGTSTWTADAKPDVVQRSFTIQSPLTWNQTHSLSSNMDTDAWTSAPNVSCHICYVSYHLCVQHRWETRDKMAMTVAQLTIWQNSHLEDFQIGGWRFERLLFHKNISMKWNLISVSFLSEWKQPISICTWVK